MRRCALNSAISNQNSEFKKTAGSRMEPSAGGSLIANALSSEERYYFSMISVPAGALDKIVSGSDIA